MRDYPPRDPSNPFQRDCEPYVGVPYVQDVTAYDRADRLKGFNVEQLRQVVALPGVQTSVKEAAERRLRKLTKGSIR